MYWNPTNSTQIPENQKPPQTQKLRNSNSETQKLQHRNSESPSFWVSEAECPGFRGRVSESDNFGQFWRWHKSPKHYVYSGQTHFGSFRAGFFSDKIGQLRNSTSKTQKHKLRNWFSEFLSRTFRVSESEFPKLRGFRAVRVRVDSNTLGPLKA